MVKGLMTIEETEFLKANFDKMTYPEMGRLLGHNPKYLRTRASQLGLRKLAKNEYLVDYFKTWSADMAYLLGFITADGHLFYDEQRGNYGVQIEVNTKDKAVLEFIRDQISPNQIVRSYIRERDDKRYELSFLRIGNKEIADSLIKLGIVPNKTGNEVLPNIPDEFKGDYLRGLFDGDGCIFTRQIYRHGNKNGTERKYCIASKSVDFLESVKSDLCFGAGKINPGNGCHSLDIYNRESICQIRDFMYRNDGFSLTRKRDKLLAI
jgi:intein/homing endonuclease